MLKEPIKYSYCSETTKKASHISGQERLQIMIDSVKNIAYEEMRKNPPHKDFLPGGKVDKKISAALRILDIKYSTVIGTTNYLKLMSEIDRLAKESNAPMTNESTAKIFRSACKKVAPKLAEYYKKKHEIISEIRKNNS